MPTNTPPSPDGRRAIPPALLLAISSMSREDLLLTFTELPTAHLRWLLAGYIRTEASKGKKAAATTYEERVEIYFNRVEEALSMHRPSQIACQELLARVAAYASKKDS